MMYVTPRLHATLAPSTCRVRDDTSINKVGQRVRGCSDVEVRVINVPGALDKGFVRDPSARCVEDNASFGVTSPSHFAVVFEYNIGLHRVAYIEYLLFASPKLQYIIE